MSKLTAEMSHKKRIEENLTLIDNQEEKEAAEQSVRIKNKMVEIEDLRNKILEEKTKSYRKNDEKWLNKLKEIQHKFREQNKDAMEKAQKYREDSENYWKSKEKKFQDLERQNYENSRIQASQLRNFNKSYEERRMSEKKFYSKDRKSLNTQKSPETKKKYSSILNVDSQIKAHQFRSITIQREKEAEMFQKSMEKLDRIDQKRKEKSDKLLKESLKKMEKPLKSAKIEDAFASERKMEKERERNKTSFVKISKNKESLDDVIKYRMLNKERIEDYEFEQRGEILESIALKNKKDRILKMIKNKIKDMKVNVIIKQSSATKLNSH